MAGSLESRASVHLREQGPGGLRPPGPHGPGGLPGQAHCPASSCTCTRESESSAARAFVEPGARPGSRSVHLLHFANDLLLEDGQHSRASSRTSSNTTPHSNSSLTFLK